MRSLLTVVVIVTLVASGLIALMWSQQRRLIYFPSPGPVPSAAAVLPNGRDVVLDTEDGIRLGAWYFPGRQRRPPCWCATATPATGRCAPHWLSR